MGEKVTIRWIQWLCRWWCWLHAWWKGVYGERKEWKGVFDVSFLKSNLCDRWLWTNHSMKQNINIPTHIIHTIRAFWYITPCHHVGIKLSQILLSPTHNDLVHQAWHERWQTDKMVTHLLHLWDRLKRKYHTDYGYANTSGKDNRRKLLVVQILVIWWLNVSVNVFACIWHVFSLLSWHHHPFHHHDH